MLGILQKLGCVNGKELFCPSELLSVEGNPQGKVENDCCDALQGAADILKFEVNKVFLTGRVVRPGAV